MQSCFECIPCFTRQAVEAIKIATDDTGLRRKIISRVLSDLSEYDYSRTPPEMGRHIHKIVKEMTGNADPYLDIKRTCNRLAADLYPAMAEKVKNSPDRIETALQLVQAANVIDFGTGAVIDDKTLNETIERALKMPVDTKVFEEFKAQINDAEKILYLADNTGEIIFDKLFIEQLPVEKITVAVRAEPIINDATIDDARFAGLCDIVNVIDNGYDAPGTVVEKCSAQFREAFENADVIISKGQGNFETLNESEANIFFILKVKCPAIAAHLKRNIGDFFFENISSNKALQKEPT